MTALNRRMFPPRERRTSNIQMLVLPLNQLADGELMLTQEHKLNGAATTSTSMKWKGWNAGLN